MTFHPREGARAKERILVYSAMGGGKTYGWTELADMYRKTDTPGMFYVVSTEFQSADRALELYGEVENVEIQEALDWSELTRATEDYKARATSDDWLVVDSIGAAWQYAQNDHTQQRWGKDAKRYFGELEDKGDAEINWPVVNDQYRQWILPNVLRFPGHVYACSPAEDLRAVNRSGKDPESKEIRQLFGRFGSRPAGQKDLGYQFHTVLKLEQQSRDTFTMTTVDDHARKRIERESVVSFPFTYLMQVAGWETS